MVNTNDDVKSMDELLDTISEEELVLIDKLLLRKLIEPELEQDNLPDEIYHYTSAIGLKGILDKHALWFTHYRFLNDKSEKEYTYRLLEECLTKNKKKLNDGFLVQLMNGLHPKTIHRRKTDWFNDIYQVPEYYVASFACNGDSLSLWNYYTKSVDKTGYNIKFSLKKLKKSLDDSGFSVHRVIYEKAEQERKLNRLINSFHNAWDERRSAAYLGIIVALFWEMIDETSITFKSPMFMEENEVRIVYKVNEGGNTEEEFREMNGIFVPYYEKEFSKKSVKGITISPTQQDELAIEGVRRLLEHYKYEKVGADDVKVSGVPLRY